MTVRPARETGAPFGRGRRACMPQTLCGESCGRGELSPREGRVTRIHHLPFLSSIVGGASGGERCRVRPSMPGWCGWLRGAGLRDSRGCRARPGRRSRSAGSGSSGGGLSHSAAMIASNSDRSRSSSEKTRSRNISSALRVAMSPSDPRVAGMTVTAVHALMVCRSLPLLVMDILRGLAFSATGICNVSTPPS